MTHHLSTPFLCTFSLVASLLMTVACSSSSSSSSSSVTDAGSDGDALVAEDICVVLGDWQASAHCAKFDTSRYLNDCRATESPLTSACRESFTALAECLVKQPVACTDAGTIDDTIPSACASLNHAFEACANPDGGK